MFSRLTYNALFATIFLLSIFGAYYGVVRFHYPVPPGDDIYVHLSYTLTLLRHGLSAPVGYPPGLYFLVIGLAKFFHTNILSTFVWLAPALLPLSALAIWYLARVLFTAWQALLAYALYALISLQPLQTYFDGSLPNLLAAGILLPLLFATIIRAVNKKQITAWICPSLLLGLIVICHHLTVLVMLGTLLIWSFIAIAVTSWIRWRWKGLGFGAVMGIAMVTVCIGIFWFLPAFSAARGIIHVYVQFDPQFPFFHPQTAADTPAWNANDFGLNVGGIIFQAALVGAVAVFIHAWKISEGRLGRLLLLIWFALYLFGSFTSLSGEPSRLARDFSMPASILAAVGLIWLADLLASRSSTLRIIYWIFIGIVALPLASIRMNELTTYSSMVRFSSADQQAYAYLLISGFSNQTAVLTHQPDWQTVSAIRNTAGQFVFVPYDSLSTAKIYPCYLDTNYKILVTPPSRGDSTSLDPLRPALHLVETFVDPSRTVRLLCRS